MAAVSSAEARGFHKASGLDVNEDGAVSTEELITAAAMSVAEKQTKFAARYDANEDGDVSGAESLAVAEASVSAHFDHIIGHLDTNEDGAISDEDDRPFRGRRGVSGAVSIGAFSGVLKRGV